MVGEIKMLHALKKILAVFVAAAFFPCQMALAAEPIKILVMDVMSGPFKDEGEQYVTGARFAVEEINKAGGINGRQIQLIVDDTQLKPDVAQRKAIRHILDDNVKIIVGAVATSVVKALAQVADKHKVVLAAYSGEADEITGKEFVPEVFRLILSTSMHARATVASFPNPDAKKIYLLNQDNAFGHSAAAAYKKALDQLRPGWTLVGEDYHPIATKDFAPYLQKILSSGADVILTGDYGADMTLLLKQANNFGIKQPFGNMFLSNPVALRELDKAAIGSFTSDIYMLGADTQKNREFIERWKAQKNPPYPMPDFGIGKAYNVVMFLAEAIKKAGSEDHDALIKAFEGLEYDGIMGRQVIRACDHQIQSQIASSTIVPGPGAFYTFASPGPVKLLPLEQMSVAPEDTGNPRCMKK